MKVDIPPIADEKGLAHDTVGSLPLSDGTVPRRNKLSNLRKALAGVLLFLSVGYLFGGFSNPHPHHPHRHPEVPVDGETDFAPYWSGIVDKGMRLAVKQGKSHSHEENTAKHGKHHNHDHEPHKGKHGNNHHHGDNHDHHHHGKHGKHGDHGKHGKHGKHHDHPPPPFIPPRMAEKLFLEVPNNDSVRAASRRYTDHAHIAGSGWDFVDAITLKSEWEAALGLPLSGSEDFIFESGSQESQDRVLNADGKMGVWIDTYYPTMNTPVSSFVKLHSDPPFNAKLQEDIVEGDPDSVLRDEVRVFHGLSVSGHVKGQYVYVGYGRKKDFEMLQAHGVDFKGKIVITKYGGVFRGLKIKAAQEAGAVGVLIYSDPADDGEYTEEHGYKAYPDGPARQPSSVQRGSVQFYSGDPATPGKPAYRNATRTEGDNIPSIPSLPISYEDALPILTALNGKGSKVSDFGQEWVGGLGYKGVEYWTGPSDIELEMKNEVNTRIMPIWNVMATIPGHISDEVVVVGNHRDGAGDPSSGTASMYEMIRGLGTLLRKGWKPMRTIILASWDAEEYGLIGSVEWTEDFGDWLSAHTVAYLNMDVSVSGKRFEAGASPSLAWLLRQSAERVLTSADPDKTVWDARLDGEDFDAWRAEKQGLTMDIAESGQMGDHSVKPLGSGSDFTSFLQRFGIASSNIGYSVGPKDPVYHYHSIYDSFTWQEKFADPGFHRHVDAAKVFGLMTLRMADSLMLPINTTQYALDLIYYQSKVQQIAKETNQTSGLDMTALNLSIHKLINSSMALDHKRSVTLKKLEKLLPKPKKGKVHRAFGKLLNLFHRLTACCGLSARSGAGRAIDNMITWQANKVAEVDRTGWPDIPKIPKIPGLPHSPEPKPPKEPDHPHPPHEPSHPPPPPPPTHRPPHHPPHHPPPPPHIPKDKLKEIKHLLLEIKEINSVLQSFECGFISQEGIKDREWYRHKGVAPGKWLGYGATTFPALTEALAIDHSIEMAQKEADELAEMINKMAQKLSKAA